MIQNKKPYEMLVEQVANEYGNHFFYLRIAGHYENMNYRGFAKYFKDAANEELEHANKILEYLYKKQYVFTVPMPNERPMPEEMSDIAIAEERLRLEEMTTDEINEIYEAAKGQYGITSVNGMKKFVETLKCEPSIVETIGAELIALQDDEIQEAQDFLAKVKMATNILVLDAELAK